MAVAGIVACKTRYTLAYITHGGTSRFSFRVQ